VADSGPGTHTRDPASIPVNREKAGKQSTQEWAVRTTDLGRLVVPDVGKEMSAPRREASSTAPAGSGCAPTSMTVCVIPAVLGIHLIERPASTVSASPVTYRDWSEARNSTALLTSSGSTMATG
jgi:hypothetical protein